MSIQIIMRFFLAVISVWVMFVNAFGQNHINQYEYWYDGQYSSRVTTDVTPANLFHLNAGLPATTLTEGLHAFHIRFRDDSLVFSSVLSAFFIKLGNAVATSTSMKTYEYWFDNNYTGKITGSLSMQQTASLETMIPTPALDEGMHVFHIRFQDAIGQWSSVISELFMKLGDTGTSTTQLVNYEYWFDEDFAGRVTGNLPSQQTIVLTAMLPANALHEGLHLFRIRFKDGTGQWSSVNSQFFLKLGNMSSGQSRVTGYEYWFDQDFTSRIVQSVAPQQNLALAAAIPAEDLPEGLHAFYIRFQDSTGQWSSVQSRFFVKLGHSTTAQFQLSSFEYWFDQDYAGRISEPLTGNNIEQVLAGINTDSLEVGLHSFYIRFRDGLGQWSGILGQLFYKQGKTSGLVSNQIDRYRYWFDNDFSKVKEVPVTSINDLLELDTVIDLTRVWKGSHRIHLQFRDSMDMWSSVITDTVQKLSFPIAEFGALNSSICSGDTVFFVNTSVDGDEYHWNFGDGHISNNIMPYHIFADTGTYTVSLTITDTLTMLDSTFVNLNFVKAEGLVVYTADDSIAGSMRHVIFCAAPNDTITFSNGLDTVFMAAPIDMAKDLTLENNSLHEILVKGDISVPGFSGKDYLFKILHGFEIGFKNLEFLIVNPPTSFSAFLNHGQLTLEDLKVTGNSNNLINNIKLEPGHTTELTVKGNVEVRKH